MYASYRGTSVMHIFVNGHPVITIAQSIHCVTCTQFRESSRELLRSLVFDKLSSCDVTIRGSDSQIRLDYVFSWLGTLTL